NGWRRTRWVRNIYQPGVSSFSPDILQRFRNSVAFQRPYYKGRQRYCSAQHAPDQDKFEQIIPPPNNPNFARVGTEQRSDASRMRWPRLSPAIPMVRGCAKRSLG